MREHNRTLRDAYQNPFSLSIHPHFWRKLSFERQVMFELRRPWIELLHCDVSVYRVDISIPSSVTQISRLVIFSPAMKADLGLDHNENYFLDFLRLSIVIWPHATYFSIETVCARWRISAYITIILSMDMAMPKRWVTLSVGCTSNS